MSKIIIPEIQEAVVKKVATPAPTPTAPAQVFTQPVKEENQTMSWFTDVRNETLKQLGIDTPAGVVEQVGKTVTGGIPSANNEVKQSQPLYVAPAPGTPPAAAQAAVQAVTDNKGKIILLLVVGFFAFKLLSKK